MRFIPLDLPGLVLIQPKKAQDERGFFVKPFSADLFHKHGIDFTPREMFYSVSRAGVLRGMHFQSPPSSYGKLVHCVRGRVHDVALDLRAGSPTYGRVWSGEFEDGQREALFLPAGFAHGFYSLAPESVVLYQVDRVHDPGLDKGIRWDSFGHRWPGETPIVSPRDCGFPPLDQFETPFRYP